MTAAPTPMSRNASAASRASSTDATLTPVMPSVSDSLGVTKSHSRPHVSNDSPFSESQFKTMKYRPGYPDRFGSIQDARAWARPFFHWYNHEHHHSGLALLTPATVHYGQAQTVIDRRQMVLQAFAQNRIQHRLRRTIKPNHARCAGKADRSL